MKPLGGKPKKQYEMSEKERLLNQIRKANNEAEYAKSQVKLLKNEVGTLRERAGDYFKDHNMIQFLMGQEVIIATDEGMKYLKGLDLINYCKEKLTEQEPKVWVDEKWGVSLNNITHPINKVFEEVYAKHAEQLKSQIDSAVLESVAADTFTYQTKGRYDTRGKSKKESR